MRLKQSIQNLDLNVVSEQVRLAYLGLESVTTHKKMAEFTGITPSFFSEWLSGKRQISRLWFLHALIAGYPAGEAYAKANVGRKRLGPSPGPRAQSK